MCLAEELDLSRNAFTGTIPSEIGRVSHLRELSLEFNELEGQLPSEIGQLTLLSTLSIQNNNFSGTIPTSVCSLQNSGVVIVHGAGAGNGRLGGCNF